MILDWFNAREAVDAGASLADYFLSKDAAAVTARPGRRSGQPRPDVQNFLQRAAKEVRPLKLNVFKRAKLLGSFKWRLLEHDFDPGTVDELTHLLMLQITGAPADLAAAGAARAAKPGEAGSSRRIPSLLAEADARFAAREFAQAIERLQEVIAINPRHAIAHAKLGAAHFDLGRYREAEDAFRRAIELKADCADAHLNLGVLLQLKGEFAASETALRRAVKQDPANPEALVGLGMTLAMRGHMTEAKSRLEKALRLKPSNASALCAHGWAASIEGRFEEAEKWYRAAIESDPQKSAAWAWLSGLRRMTPEDSDWLEGVRRTLAGGVPPLEESRLRFAMGKYFDDLGKYSRAFEEYTRGNELFKRLVPPYDRAARTAFVDDMIHVYTKDRLAQPLQGSCDSARPVFVTGMMRSGTSLVEQIIASHPEAVGAGELDFWSDAARRHEQTLRKAPPEAALARRLADSYLRELARHSAEAPRVVDKATFNSNHLGLIHTALPRARIVYVRRDPIDTCLSCYFQDFANAANFTMALSDLAHYYREHHRLVTHWRASLPQGALLEVPYADLVADPEAWSRRIIDFIGLPWDPRCLEFHLTRRSVVTASSWQVRQRIYSSSVGRWRNYRKFIGPLLELQSLTG